MNLIIDLGNTSHKLALYDKDELCKFKAYPKLKKTDVILFCKGSKINAAILSSVVNVPAWLEPFLQNLFPTIRFDNRTSLPVKNLYKTPATLGNDRLACAVAAHALSPKAPVLAIDAGTCIKYDFVNARGEYLGGAIAPGLKMRLQALHTFTAKLPLVQLAEEKKLTGDTTESSILSGVINGAQAEIEGIIDRYSRQHKGLKVVLTGGDMEFFAGKLKNRIFAEPFLVMHGLNLILNHNAPNKK